MTRRFVLAVLVSALPSNRLRIALWRILFGYEIHPEARIGALTLIDVEEARIGRVEILGTCAFRGPFRLAIGDDTRVGRWNTVECGAWVTDPVFKDTHYARECRIGKDCLVTTGHFVDATGGFSVGDRTHVGGRGSQFWTHGAGMPDPSDTGSVSIGSDCVVSSRVIFTPGSAVADGTQVASGSVVTTRLEATNVLIGGVPARILREGWDHRSQSPVYADDGTSPPTQ